MKPVTLSFYREVVQRAVEHVARRLDDAIELEVLATEACLSPFHFHRIFRGMVGETPLTLSRRLRMERAAWHLAQGDEGVTRIAFDAGYETHEGFTRAFRALYATSPSGFRQRKYPRIFLAASSGVHFDPAGQVASFQPRDSGGANMNVEIKPMPELRVGCVRHIGPYNQIARACERLGQLVDHTDLTASPEAAMIAIYYDDPEAVPPEQLRSDAGLIVPESAALPRGLSEQRIPQGLYARTSHVGSYELLGDVWARFMGEWLPASGHQLGPGVSYELYRNTPNTTPTEELRTDLYLPITPPRA
jgi:AraC family transcriptional regulator